MAQLREAADFFAVLFVVFLAPLDDARVLFFGALFLAVLREVVLFFGRLLAELVLFLAVLELVLFFAPLLAELVAFLAVLEVVLFFGRLLAELVVFFAVLELVLFFGPLLELALFLELLLLLEPVELARLVVRLEAVLAAGRFDVRLREDPLLDFFETTLASWISPSQPSTSSWLSRTEFDTCRR